MINQYGFLKLTELFYKLDDRVWLLNQWSFQKHYTPQEEKDNQIGFLVLYRARGAYSWPQERALWAR